jgi:aspartate/methionine/tyrosine aminotransferase
MPLAPFRLERFFGRYEFVVEHLLSASDSETVTIDDLLALEPGARQALGRLRLGYTESTGSPELREAIAGVYQGLSPDEVLVAAGAEEAIFAFVHGVLRAGDHVVVQWPCYQSVVELPASVGCAVTRWEARADRGWEPRLDELEAQIGPGTRAVFVNTPANPTGFHFSPERFADLVALCRRHGLLLFCDEVYRELEYDEARRLPAACDLYEHAVSLGVMSKTYGLAGLRIGWVATRRADVRAAMIQVKDYTTICSSAPSELLATIALRHREVLAARNRELAVRHLGLLDLFFDRQRDRLSWVRPQAGPICFPRLEREVDVDALCGALAERDGVLIAPGSLFDLPRHFRLGFGRATLPEALAAFERALDRHL